VKKNGRFNKPISEETREKLKRPKSEIAKQNMKGKHLNFIPWNKGKPKVYSEETLQKLRNIKHICNERKCPHCELIGKGPNMTRYHFDNCKFKKIRI